MSPLFDFCFCLCFLLGGSDLNFAEYGHVAAIICNLEDDVEAKCTGSLISENFILTSRICIEGCASIQRVILGSPFVCLNCEQNFPYTYSVNKIFLPDIQGKEATSYEDIALIKLNENVTFSTFIKPACIYTKSDLQNETDLVAIGWQGYYNGLYFLQKTSVLLISNEDCTKIYKQVFPEIANILLPDDVIDSQFCAFGVNGDIDKDDVGGPMQTYDSVKNATYITGVITSVSGIADGIPMPVVFTKLNNFAPWIEGIVWGSEEGNSTEKYYWI